MILSFGQWMLRPPWYDGKDLGLNKYEVFGKIQNISESQFPHNRMEQRRRQLSGL